MRELDRVITPEILDSLDPKDLRAIRSRRDLRLIDFYLGNTRWTIRQIKKLTPLPARIVEIGAGEGILCCKIQSALPSASVTGLDLINRPEGIHEGIEWISGDFFRTLSQTDSDTCIGSLVLHHFQENALRELGVILSGFRHLIFSEPLRSRLPLALSKMSSVFMSEVTRHDMPTSIRAGFQQGELSEILKLDSKKWHLRESYHWRGVCRLIASRR